MGCAPASSRVVYNRLEGSPNSGSTIEGCDGHGTLNTHIIAGYVPSGSPYDAFPFADGDGYQYGLGVCPFVKVGASVIFDPKYTFPDYSNLQADAYQDGMKSQLQQLGRDGERCLHQRCAGV